MEEHGQGAPRQSGLTRRDLIRRGAVAGGILWTAPLVLQTAAGASGGCSPCTCATNYSGKWNTNAANLCTAVLSNPSSGGPNGIDPFCGNVSGGPSSYTTGSLSTLQVVNCSSTSITFRLKCSGKIYGIKVKGATVCQETVGGDCVTELTASIPSNLSHIVVYWCCC